MDEAIRRFVVLKPYLDDGVSLAADSRIADVPIRTAQRWLSRYRDTGLLSYWLGATNSVRRAVAYTT